MSLMPSPEISAPALVAGKRALVADAAWASMTGALSGGVVLVAFALELGAGPRAIGLLGAIPFIAQAAQLPAMFVVERIRRRKLIGIPTITLARLLILLLAVLPMLPDSEPRLALLLLAQAFISVLSSAASCAINAWFHQLLSPSELGVFFSRRLLWATGLACICTLGAGVLVEHPPLDSRMLAFTLCFAGAGIAGLLSSASLYRCPEPEMDAGGPVRRMRDQLRGPFIDRDFRGLLLTLASWNLASNLVAPFLTVYLMQQLGFGLSQVTALWVMSQVCNAATLLAWGRVSDRLSNKSVLAVAVPLYFSCTLGLVFVPVGASPLVQFAFLAVLHALMGVAGGGIGLATGNLGMKLAPRDRATSYLAAIGLVGAVAGGLAPLAGGTLAQWFSERQLSLLVRWVSPGAMREVSVFSFAHWEFLFAISALLGLYVMHAVSRVREGSEVSERRVIQELGLEALRTVNQVSTVGGVLGNLFPFGRLSERRRASRDAPRPSSRR
ncbi:MAG: MFS transporter [Roseateles sp.]|uniref:MFS transporter n=1 Tax=Roseateles sp. TaxID=1971397 RepID=UPI004036780D